MTRPTENQDDGRTDKQSEGRMTKTAEEMARLTEGRTSKQAGEPMTMTADIVDVKALSGLAHPRDYAHTRRRGTER